MTGIFLVLVIVLMGGIIAYLGDKLGTKVGRQRASIFGLRPRHTALIFSIFSGVLVSVLTLGVLTVSSQDVRTALFGMEKMKKELSEVKGFLDESKLQLSLESQKYAGMNQQVQETTAKLLEVNQDLAKVSDERNLAIERMKAAKIEYEQAKQALNQADAKMVELQSAKKDLESNVLDLTQSKQVLLNDINKLNDLTEKLQKNIQDVREGLLLFRTGENIFTAVADFKNEIKENQEILNKLLKEANSYFIEKFSVQNKEEKVVSIEQTEIVAVAKHLAENKQGNYVVRFLSGGNVIFGETIFAHIEIFPNRFIFSKGEVVGEKRVDVGANAEKAEEALTTFLQEINNKAAEKGVLRDPLTGKIGALSGEDLFSALKELQSLKGQVLLEAITTQDIYTVGPLRIVIKVKA